MQLGRLRFPADRSFTEGVKLGWGIAPIEISEEIRLRLQALSRQVRSTPILVAFTAYVALVLRWCHSVEGVILFMSDGREDMRLRNTCGYFAAPLYIYTKIEGGDSFLDLLGRLTTGYSNAYQHADHSYLEAQLPRPEIAKNTVFNWIPRLTGKDSSEYPASKGRVVYSQLAFDLPFLHILERDSEPMVVLYETESGISGGVYFPRDRFSFAGMTVFANNFVAFIEHLLQDPEREVLGVPITAQPYATASALEAGGTRGKCLSLHEGNI
jgi:non-ribosomal peptide synthetase component F